MATDVIKTEKVEVRLNAEEKQAFLLAAEILDMTISDFVRFWCLPAARQIAAGAPVEQVRASSVGTADYMTARYQASTLSPSGSFSGSYSPSLLEDAMKPKKGNEQG